LSGHYSAWPNYAPTAEEHKPDLSGLPGPTTQAGRSGPRWMH
jgi:hypothetical protein